MNAAELLRKDHAEINKLLDQAARTTARAARTRVHRLERLARALDIHAHIEEEIFYPAAEEVDAIAALVQEGRREHRHLAGLVGEILEIDPADEALSGKIRTLRDVVRHHVAEEERRILPKVEQALGEDALARIGIELRVRKQQLARGRVRLPRVAA